MPRFIELATRIAQVVPAAATVLEIAPGPGFLAIELAKRGLAVRAVDISKTFIEIARHNAAAAGVAVRFDLGDAAALPVADASVDFAVCCAAFKNFSRPVQAMAEMRRALRPGGTALLIDMRRDVSRAAVKDYVESLDVGRLNRWFMLLVFHAMLIRRAYPLDAIRSMAAQAGWIDPHIEVTPVGFEAWMTK